MRITDSILFNNFLYNINKVNEKTYVTNEELASGKRLLNLSSDPIALSKVLSLKDINMRFDQYVTNIDSANSVLNAEDTALSNADDLIHKAGALLVEGANSTNNDDASRTAISEELDSITDELRNSANTIFQGKYLFSGFKTDEKPIQDKTQEVVITDTGGSNVETSISNVYKDVNQFETGDYTIHIKDGRLYITDNAGKVVPIDEDSKDESNVGGNILSDSINISGKENQWIDTGRGIKIKLSDVTSQQTISVSYKAGGRDIYEGDDGERDVEYSDGLTSPITITARDIYKPTNQTVENNNYMLDKTTNNPVTKETKLTDITLAESLKNVAIDTGYAVEIKGTDHNGNIVSGIFNVSSTSLTINDLINKVESLDSTEELTNNKTLITSGGKIAVGSTTLGSLGIVATTSTLVFSGTNHSGVAVNVSYAVSAGTTISSVNQFIATNFDATVEVNHGKIVIEDNKNGESDLSVSAYKKSDNNPVFGYFFETSKGGSGGFKDTVEGYVKDGHLFFKDKRPSDSKFNLSFTIKDTTTSPAQIKPNIFGVFNQSVLGKGIDVFKEMRDASYALKHPNENNQIGLPTHWSQGTTMKPVITGEYLGGNNDTWTVSVAEGSNDLSVDGAKTTLEVTDKNNNKVATVNIVNNAGRYDIQVTNKDGILIYNAKDADNLNNIVIETTQAKNSFNENDTGVNGTAGVTLNFSSGSLKEVFETGDSFSFKLSNSIENAIGKSEEALNQILAARSVVGARTNRMSLAQSRISYTQVSNSKTISELEDANVAKVYTDYQRNLTVMKALLNTGSQLTSQNLFDYLR